MVYAIENEFIRVAAETKGAQVKSIFRKDGGIEHLWQGDPAFWKNRGPMLFPLVGRSVGGKYAYNGKEYAMGVHGFAREKEFVLVEKTNDKMTFAFSATEETLECYPFNFILKISYEIKGASVIMNTFVENVGDGVMYFGLGGHPGFNVPFDGGNFEDYYLETDNDCTPKHLTLSENYMMSGEEVDYLFENNRILKLKHNLFDNDAVILEGCDRSLTIKSTVTKKAVNVKFPKMPFVGIWHTVKAAAPFVCIEPWENLPALDGSVEDITSKTNIGKLEPNESYESPIIITLL